jgi:hypothetical protein
VHKVLTRTSHDQGILIHHSSWTDCKRHTSSFKPLPPIKLLKDILFTCHNCPSWKCCPDSKDSKLLLSLLSLPTNFTGWRPRGIRLEVNMIIHASQITCTPANFALHRE